MHPIKSIRVGFAGVCPFLGLALLSSLNPLTVHGLVLRLLNLFETFLLVLKAVSEFTCIHAAVL